MSEVVRARGVRGEEGGGDEGGNRGSVNCQTRRLHASLMRSDPDKEQGVFKAGSFLHMY